MQSQCLALEPDRSLKTPNNYEGQSACYYEFHPHSPPLTSKAEHLSYMMNNATVALRLWCEGYKERRPLALESCSFELKPNPSMRAKPWPSIPCLFICISA